MATNSSPDQEMEIEEETDSKLIKEAVVEEEIDYFDEDEEYDMTRDPRGKAIIFNHKEYEPHMQAPKRDGTEKDKDRIKKVLTDLGFVVEPYEDPTLLEIQTALEQVSRNDYKYDCLVIVVMTHGNLVEIQENKNEVGKLFRLAAKDRSYNEEELWKPFTEGKCHQTLLKKPKIIFNQSCRIGKDKDRNNGVWVSSHSQKEGKAEEVTEKKQDIYSIPHEADILIARSTYDGCYAYRHTTCGSRFIQTICEKLEDDMKRDDDEKHDLLRILTAVNRTVAFKYPKIKGTKDDIGKVAEYKQMPNFYSTLTRMVYFRNLTKSDDDF